MLKHFAVITLFPEIVHNYLSYGILARAVQRDLITVQCFNPRQYLDAAAGYSTIDDRPFGGGPGMVLRPEPLVQAIAAARALPHLADAPVVYLTPQGQPLRQQHFATAISDYTGMIFLAGRYEGIDERVITKYVNFEWSIGDYVLSGGELPALTCIDAMVRLMPNALGHEQSARQDSFSTNLLDHPHYTRPRTFQDMDVPEVLCSGDHQAIAKWRHEAAYHKTKTSRPDLLET